MKAKKAEPVVATNRKAAHDFHILEAVEAGIALTGTEVKSARAGKVNLRDSYARIKDEEVFVHGMHISPYGPGTIYNQEPKRPRKLLLHKQEIRRLIGKTKEKGLTLIPLKLYLRDNRIKLELALARGKALYDKRRALAEKEARREVERAFRERQKQ